MTAFTAQLWDGIAPVYRAILGHPFLAGLADGSLPEPAFRYYVLQDALYLRDFARGLAVAAAKAPEDSWCELFAQHATVALAVERGARDPPTRSFERAHRRVPRGLPGCVLLTGTQHTSFGRVVNRTRGDR